MTNFLIENEEVRLVTLGPSGTTSSVIANKLKDVFEAEKNRKVVIDLFDTFELALSEISNNKADMILVPNAYHRITTFYWNTKLELVYSFVAGTPNYGLAAIDKERPEEGRVYTVATCKAVAHLIGELWDTSCYKRSDYKLVEAESTKKSLELLEQHKVDLAITNDTSLVKSDAFFVSKTMSTEVLWSVFMHR